MVPNVGFELTTYRLQGGCSTVELIRRNRTKSESNYLDACSFSSFFEGFVV